MAILAIRGHRVRGKEVIELLMMLGGVNNENFKGNVEKNCYYINSMKIIDWGDFLKAFTYTHVIFTLEEFLEKFPYKVGDKVIAPTSGKTHIIKSMYWNGNKVCYNTVGEGFNTSYCAEDLKPYKEQPYLNPKAEEAKEEIKENLKEAKTIMEETIKIDIPKGYEFVGVDDNNQQVVLERIKPQYPKTYEECCKLLNKATFISFEGLSLGEVERYKPYIKLCRCRDAYWKIAGDWKPEFRFGKKKYCVMTKDNRVITATIEETNRILVFPTEEMRDNFFENFKELIEECKELL